MSLLITSISNKRPMIQALATAAHDANWLCYGSDMNPQAPAIQDVDCFIQLPASSDKNYKEIVLKLVQEKSIKLILPSRDGDLMPLAMIRNELASLDCILPLPSIEKIHICQDKLLFSNFAMELGLKTIPLLYDISEKQPPYFTRERHSSGSKGAYRIDSQDEAQLILRTETHLLHPFIDAPEYTIDILLDFNSTPLEAVCRRRLQVIDGESKISTVEDHSVLKEQAFLLAHKLGLKGHNIIQAFLDDSGNPIFIEVNLRFGGASILALKAGMDTALAQIKMAKGEEVSSELFPSINYGLSLKREQVDGEECDFFTLNEVFPRKKNTSSI